MRIGESGTGRRFDPRIVGAQGLIVVSVAHGALFLVRTLPRSRAWWRGSLRNGGLAGRAPREDLVPFWAGLGGLAVPGALLGALAVHDLRRGATLPGWLGPAVGGWGLLAAAVTFPSPFVLVALLGGLLTVPPGGRRPSGGWRRRRGVGIA